MAREEGGTTAPPSGYDPPPSSPSRPGGTTSSRSSYYGDLPADRQPIGDPSTFAGGGAFGAFYTFSDIYGPASWDPGRIFTLQARLQAGGWISGEIGQPGIWAEESQNAFEHLLSTANIQGMTWQDLLNQSIQAYEATSGMPGAGGRGGGGGGSMLEPLIIQLPNEDDVRRGVEDVFRNLTDVDGGDDFYQRITEQYMDHLRDIQLADYEARAGGTTTIGAGASPSEAVDAANVVEQEEPQSLESFATEQIERERPGAVRNAKVGDAEETFLDVMTRSYG